LNFDRDSRNREKKQKKIDKIMDEISIEVEDLTSGKKSVLKDTLNVPKNIDEISDEEREIDDDDEGG
jgi:ribosomal protein S11